MLRYMYQKTLKYVRIYIHTRTRSIYKFVTKVINLLQNCFVFREN